MVLRKQSPEPVFGIIKFGDRIPPVPAAWTRSRSRRVEPRHHGLEHQEKCMRSAWAERSPSAALERRGCPKISPPPPRVIAAMFVGEVYDSIRGRIDAGKKSSPSPTGC
jgi:hypothetical protein